jgi:CheY-like chemotaxis protein
MTGRRIRSAGDFERPSELSGLRVLVVDDDQDARELVKAVLEECGSTVVSVDNVESALAALAESRSDVLISDIGMPGQDGYDLIRRVRALSGSEGGAIPAAALTAYARAEDRSRALHSGYSMHIAKPVEPAELVAVVAALARSRSAGLDHARSPEPEPEPEA